MDSCITKDGIYTIFILVLALIYLQDTEWFKYYLPSRGISSVLLRLVHVYIYHFAQKVH